MTRSNSFRNSDVDHCLDQPECAVISDMLAIANDCIPKDHLVSLSGYGWVARFLLCFIRDRAVPSPSGNTAKSISIPAQQRLLKDPGQVKPGFHSDICAFHQGSIASNAIARDPRGSALGTTEVPVSGRLFMRNCERMSEKDRAGLA